MRTPSPAHSRVTAAAYSHGFVVDFQADGAAVLRLEAVGGGRDARVLVLLMLPVLGGGHQVPEHCHDRRGASAAPSPQRLQQDINTARHHPGPGDVSGAATRVTMETRHA